VNRNTRINLEPSWLLHARNYQESSLLLEVFSRQHGRVGLIARGVRRSKKGRQGLLQPFCPLLCSWLSRGELGTLTDVERRTELASGLSRSLIASGFYLNELLLRLLPRNDAHPELFKTYQQALFALQKGEELQQCLRCFERDLLTALGYGLLLTHEALSGEAIDAAGAYNYQIESGPLRAAQMSSSPLQVQGDSLLALAAGHFENRQQRREGKAMMAAIIKHYLGGEEPRSRALLKMEWK
jgi:DNA repair protein RecO (recombination protein O)